MLQNRERGVQFSSSTRVRPGLCKMEEEAKTASLGQTKHSSSARRQSTQDTQARGVCVKKVPFSLDNPLEKIAAGRYGFQQLSILFGISIFWQAIFWVSGLKSQKS